MKTDYRKYLEDIKFKINPQEEPLPLELDENLMPIPTFRDMENVTLPFNDEEMKDKFKSIQGTTCKMSTFAIGSLINLIVSEMSEDEAFLNIGVWHGYTFFSGLLGNESKKCIAVDNFSEFQVNNPRDNFNRVFDTIKSENHVLYEMDCFEYLKKHHSSRLGLYMYDGEHTEELQLKGLVEAEPYFSDDCVIMIDDLNQGCIITNAIETFLEQSKYNYNILFEKTTHSNGHPSFWAGLFLMQKGELKQS